MQPGNWLVGLDVGLDDEEPLEEEKNKNEAPTMAKTEGEKPTIPTEHAGSTNTSDTHLNAQPMQPASLEDSYGAGMHIATLACSVGLETHSVRSRSDIIISRNSQQITTQNGNSTVYPVYTDNILLEEDEELMVLTRKLEESMRKTMAVYRQALGEPDS